MIITVPVPYRAEITLPGKRNSDTAHLVAQVPVRIEEARREDLRPIAHVDVRSHRQADTPEGEWAMHRISYWQHGDALLTPYRPPHPNASPVSRATTEPMPIADFDRGLYGAAHTLCFRGDGVSGQETTGAFLSATNPFMRPDMLLDAVRTVLDEGTATKSRVVRPGERDEAIAHAVGMAARCLALDGLLLQPSTGPRIRPLRASVEVQVNESHSWHSGVLVRNPFMVWSNCWSACELERIAPKLRQNRWSTEPDHAFEVIDAAALHALVDQHALRLVSHAESYLFRSPYPQQHGQDEMWGWSRQRGVGWYDMREAVRGHRTGMASADEISAAATSMTTAPDADEKMQPLRDAVRMFERSRGREAPEARPLLAR